jgi:hypothetical protein
VPTKGACATAACVATMNAFGKYISSTLTALLKPPHGLFLDSCYRHCGQVNLPNSLMKNHDLPGYNIGSG